MNNSNQTPDLFNQSVEEKNPLIQLKDAELIYHPSFFDKETSDKLFKSLLETVQWKQDKIMMYGKELPLPRLSAWYGENLKPYTYSGITLQPFPNFRFHCHFIDRKPLEI